MQMHRRLTRAEARAIDEALMGSDDVGYTLAQLMELAGLSVACAVRATYPPLAAANVLVVCGPGNNGGDGLVAARHLKLFGYNPRVYYPKRNKLYHFNALVKQLVAFDIPVTGSTDTDARDQIVEDLKWAHVIVDAIFGFSFTGSVRSPFDTIIKEINNSLKPVVSVDVPSGWDVEEGPLGSDIEIKAPSVLVSLTGPKLCADKFTAGKHFVGGRFVPPAISRRFGIPVPSYPDSCDQIVEIV